MMARWMAPLLLLSSVACDDGAESTPEAPTVDGPTLNEQTATLYAPATDLLLVIDDSGSMCQEQDRFGQALSALARHAITTGADLRIATVTTDMQTDPGVFQTDSTPAAPSLNCRTPDGEPLIPNTEDCPEVLPAILDVSGDYEAVERHLRCVVNQGTQGDGFESGLEAMRLGLSCDGPNRDRFAACCTEDGFDPTCTADVDFLRPHAQLLVFVLSDEDDCSSYALNPAASSRLVCRSGARSADSDIPDVFFEEGACGDLTPEACYLRECGRDGGGGCDDCDGVCVDGRCARDADICRRDRCVVSRRDNSNCAWSPDVLVPVSDYRDFLAGLKPGGLDQVSAMTVVGAERVTDTGLPVRYRPGRTSPECEGRLDDACCPNGFCVGEIQTSCESSMGLAFAGSRYRSFVAQFGGCDPLDPGSPTCPSICDEQVDSVVDDIIDAMDGYGASVCLDAQPLCVVDADTPYPCGDLEALDPRNHPVDVELSCADCTPPELRPDDVQILFDATCDSGMRAVFSARLERGLTVTLRYQSR